MERVPWHKALFDRALARVQKSHVLFSLCDYDRDYAPCPWYDELQRSRGNVPLSQLNAEIEKMYPESP